MEAFDRILVRMPNWLGDVVMATPLLRTLREAHPRAQLDILIQKGGALVLEGVPFVDDVLIFERKSEHKGLAGMRRMAKVLRERRYDLGVLTPNSFSSALLFRMAGIRRRIGWSYGGRGFLLSDRLVPEMKGHRRVPRPMPQYYLDLARRLGCEILSPHVALATTPDGEEEADRFWGTHGIGETPLVGLNVGAAFGPSKHWRPDRFGQVAAGLRAKRGMRPVVLCGPGEEALGRSVEDAVIAAGVPDVIRTSDAVLTLAGLKSVVNRLALMVTTDTGPRHFGIAFDVPVVCVMGSTDPMMTDQPGARAEVVRLDPLIDCMPCHEKICPLKHHDCLEKLEAAPVLAAAGRVLALPPREDPGPPTRSH
jgi:heptosyltransferase-2